jgi:methyltransferase (TIGR00027 family)
VFEVDQPQVIDFKTATMADLAAAPTADRRAVAIDLRNDWVAALTAAGFDQTQPTAWIAEGLLGYLPSDAQDRLLDQVTELSISGSRFATESVPNTVDLDQDQMQERMDALSARWRDHGFDLNFADLVYLEDRNEAAAYLAGHGWDVSSSTTRELFAENGLEPFADDDVPFADMVYVSATLQ